MSGAQAEKFERFKALHARPGAFVIPNPWDAGTARILTGLGFEALATTSAGLAFALGRRDSAAGLTRDQVLDNARAIVEATHLPVSADLEDGFGAAPETCAEIIRLASGVGLVGGSIEDATGDTNRPIFDFDHAVARVAAACDAARELPFVLTARVENFLHGRPDLEDTLRRLQAFQEAGADVLYAPGLQSRAEIAAVVAALERPVNVVMGLKGATLTLQELAEIGVKRVSLGSSLSRAAIGAFLRAAREVKEQGSFTFADEAVSFGEVNAVFDGPA